MKSPLLEKIVNAVLYEGYILYPYRASSRKNQRERFTFGRVYPKDYSDSQGGLEPCMCQTECLLRVTGPDPRVEVSVRFLHPMWRQVGHLSGDAEGSFRAAPEMTVDGVLYQSWQEVSEREINVLVNPLASASRTPIAFGALRSVENLPPDSSEPPAALSRRQEALQGVLEVAVTALPGDILKISVRVFNDTPLAPAQREDQDAVIMRTFVSTHAILHAQGGEFISLMDPPAELSELARQCKNIGTWPVLVGDKKASERDTMLSSPIILYDYPEVAPESPGPFFDGTEIDEILTLRVLAMTDGEKLEMRRVDEQARRLLERSESTGPREMLALHGLMRKADEDFFNPPQPMDSVTVKGHTLRAGSGVRIRPQKRADAMDMILDGKAAVIEAIEQDAEGQIHLALVLEDDPGKDLGFARQPGHRFFYSVDEVEPLEECAV